MWCLLLIVLPMALLFSESSMANLQSVSIIAAFPLGIVMIMIVYSFFKDASAFLDEQKKKYPSLAGEEEIVEIQETLEE